MSAANQQQRSNDRFANYVAVNERIGQFYGEHPEGRITTTVLEHDLERGFVLMRAEIFRNPDDAQPSATGHAYEMKSEGHVNKTSYIENCETGCVGRALQNLGYETKRTPGTAQPARPTPINRNETKQEQFDEQNWAVSKEWMNRVLDLESTAEEKSGQEVVILRAEYHRQNPATPKPWEMSQQQVTDYATWLKGF